MASVDSLSINISASASKAVAELDRLHTRLIKVSSALNSISRTNLNGLAASSAILGNMANSLQSISNADPKGVASGIRSLSKVDAGRLSGVATGMTRIATAMNMLSFNGQTGAVQDLATTVNSISRFGYRTMGNAVTNIQALGPAIRDMLTQIANAPQISANTANVLATLSSGNFSGAGSITGGGSSGGTLARSGSSLLSSAGKIASKSLGATVSGLGKVARASASALKLVFNQKGSGTLNGIRSLTSAFVGLYAKIWSIKRLLSFLSTAITSSTDLIETYHYFDVAMGKIGKQSQDAWAEYGFDSAEEYAKSFRDRSIELNEKMSGFTFDKEGNVSSTGTKSLGMDPDMVMQYQAQYAQMADSIGMSGEAALATSKAMTMLAGDWSSLRNIDFETSYQKMASALAGQSRAVRSLGIDITQAALQQTAYNIGLTTSVTNMDQATKAQLRMITILDQSRVAWGDLANTLNTPANQWRMIQQNLVSLSRTIGGIFLPIVQKVLPYVNGLVIALQRLFQWIAKMLGVDLKDTVSSTGGLNDDILGDLGDEADYASDALDAADESAKKLKRTVLGFDELHLLADNSDDGSNKSSTGTSGIGGLGAAEQGLLDDSLQDLLDEYEKVWNQAFKDMESKAEEFAKKLERIGRTIKNYIDREFYIGLGKYLASGINSLLDKALDVIDSDKILSKVTPVIDAITTTINSMVAEVDFAKIGKIVAEGLNTIVGIFNAYLGGIDWSNIGRQLSVGINSAIGNINWQWLGQLVSNGINAITGLFNSLTFGVDWEGLGKNIATGFNTMLREVNWVKVGEGLTWRFRLAWGMLRGFVYELDEKDLGRALGRVFDGAVASINWAEVGDTIAKAFEKMWGTFRVFLSKRDRYTSLGAKFASLLNHAISVKNFEAAGEVIAKSFNRLFDVLKGFIEGTDSEGGFNWQELTDAMEAGFKSFVKNIKIAEAAEILNKLIKELLTAIDEAIDEEDWQAFGKDIGEAISNIDWLTHLKSAVDIIGDALGSLFKGIAGGIFGDFGEDFAQGFIDGISGIIGLGEVAIKGIATALEALAKAINMFDDDGAKIVGGILGTFVGVEIAAGLGGKLLSIAGGLLGIKNVATGAAATNVSKFGLGIGTLNTAITNLFKAAGLGTIGSAVAVGAGLSKFAYLAKDIQEFMEVLNGRNGVVTEIGTAWEETIRNMVSVGVVLDKDSQKLLTYIDELETQGLSYDEISRKVIEKLGELGVSSDQITQNVTQNAKDTGYALEEAANSITNNATLAGDGWSKLSETFNVKGTSIETDVEQMRQLIRAALIDLQTNGFDVTSEAFRLLDEEITNGCANSQSVIDQFVNVMSSQFGWSQEQVNAFIELMKVKFPEAVSTGTSSSSTTVSNFASSVSSKLSNSKTSVAELAKEFTNVGTASKNADRDSKDMQKKFDKWTSPISGLLSSLFIGIMGGSVKTVGDNSETSTGQVNTFNTSIEGIDKDSKGRDSLAGIKTGFEEAGTASGEAATTIDTNMSGLKTKLEGYSSTMKFKGKDIGRYTVLGLKEGLDDNASKVSNSMETIISRDMGGVATRLLVIASPSKLFEGYGVYTIQGLINGLSSMTSSLQTAMNSVVYYIKSPFEGVARDIVSNFNGLGYNISRAVGSLYDVGRGLSYSLAAGFQSHHIVLPHFGWNYNRIGYGNGGYFDIPNIWVNWYAKGGLFTDPTIAGFGESGAEAALPLTNKRTMAMVSDAIVNSGGALSNSMTRDDVIDAVATGVAMAMGQNPQTVEVVVNSVLKTSDEKLAQSVSRGQARLNQRYNLAY